MGLPNTVIEEIVERALKKPLKFQKYSPKDLVNFLLRVKQLDNPIDLLLSEKIRVI